MRTLLLRLILLPVLVVCLGGCTRPQAESPSAPPGSPYAGAERQEPASPDVTDRTPTEVGADVVMTAKVKNALITSKVDTGRLNVDTKEGVVILRGSVPTAAQKSLAEKVAQQVEGVTTVTNQLTVAAK